MSAAAAQGINVFRFANRIPLLFEAGNDVATRQANKLKWDAYKIDPNRDRVGVFISIVSTKIPFKVRKGEHRVWTRLARDKKHRTVR